MTTDECGPDCSACRDHDEDLAEVETAGYNVPLLCDFCGTNWATCKCGED